MEIICATGPVVPQPLTAQQHHMDLFLLALQEFLVDILPSLLSDPFLYLQKTPNACKERWLMLVIPVLWEAKAGESQA